MSHAARSAIVALFAIVFLRAPWLVRLLNPVFQRYLALGLPGGPNVLLTVRGRRSGLPRTFPVAWMRLGDRQFIQASYGEVAWVRNLRASGQAILRRGRRSEVVLATELEPAVAGPLIHDALDAYPPSPLVRRLVGPTIRPPAAVLHYFGVRVDDALEEYLAEAARHPLFELRPSSAEGDADPSDGASLSGRRDVVTMR
jgi:deazaflavin-dependent oxidoreductase (nitroreductase family)